MEKVFKESIYKMNCTRYSKRSHYFLIHLACSIIIALILLALVFLVWYPTPLASAEGVTSIFFMLIAVDVIVGPLLSLVVYKEGKKTLKMDLSLIIFLQVLALGYGVNTIVKARPVWIVQSGWLFEVVRANEIDYQDQEKAEKIYNHNGWLQPKFVAVDDTKNPYNALSTPQLMPTTYTDLSYAYRRLKKYAQPLNTLQQFNEPQEIKKTLNRYPNTLYWMPLRTTGIGLTVLLDGNYKVIEIVDLRPWKE